MNTAAAEDARAIGRDPMAAVAAWRASGGELASEVHRHIVEAMARRAAAHQGPAREALARRIAALMAATPHFGETRSAAGAAQHTAHAARPDALQALGELADRLGRPRAQASRKAASGLEPSPRHDGFEEVGATAAPTAGAVAAFGSTWTRLRAQQRLRTALDQVPAQAGPLNSAQLVSRALQAMQRASPDYLYAFMAHVDGLLALEQASDTRKR